MGNTESLVRCVSRTATIATAIISLAATAACGAASGPSSASTSRRASLGPIGVSFVSPPDGWVLGVPLTGSKHIHLLRTTDGGAQWMPVPVPKAIQPGNPLADSAGNITFADALDGWLYGPALWATHDGGARWYQVATHGARVTDVAAASGYVFAVLAGCRHECQPGLYRSPIGRDEFRPVPGAAGASQVALSGPRGYAVSAGSMLVTGLVAGSARWRRLPLPCTGLFRSAVIAASAAGLALACDAPLGAHPTPFRVYVSADHGVHWRKVAGLYSYNGAAFLAIAPDGLMITGGMYDGMVISRDWGRTWHRVPSVDSGAVGGGSQIGAAMITNRAGFALVQPVELWLTRNGARTWTRIRLP